MHPGSFYVFSNVHTTFYIVYRKKESFIGECRVCLQHNDIFEAMHQIGINYKGQRCELKGCNNDIRNILPLLISTCGFVGETQRFGSTFMTPLQIDGGTTREILHY